MGAQGTADSGPDGAPAPDGGVPLLDAGDDTPSTDATSRADVGPADSADATYSDASAGGDALTDAVLVQLAPPTFSPLPTDHGGFTIYQPTPVTILPPSGFPDSGTLLYTTDWNMRATPDLAYTSPITVGAAGICPDPNAIATIWAQATAPGYLASSIAEGTWFSEGYPPTPTFVPTSMTANNDVSVTLSPDCLTLCYTFDGSTPTCTSGHCTGTSLTYAAATKVAIDGSVTDPSTGRVNVTAISCYATSVNSLPSSQQYELQVAAPVVSTPSAPGGPATISTVTITSNEAVSIRFTTDGSQPTCSSGTLISGSSGTTGPLATGTTVTAIACKTGYAPSSVVTHGI
jgi:hypothetical protein